MDEPRRPVIVLISANAEWQGVLQAVPGVECQPSPFGDWFSNSIANIPLIFLHGGLGKIAAAASTTYAIERWKPELVANLGTCGGFTGKAERGQVLLVDETIVYDIIEQMGDPAAALEHYSSRLDLGWLPAALLPGIQRSRLVSADRDILPQDIPMLVERFGAVAADWESGAIAWVAQKYGVRCLILRAVSDLVGAEGGEVYDDLGEFQVRAMELMGVLIGDLEEILANL